LRLGYFLRIPNVGDRINPSLITSLTGRTTQFVTDYSQPHLLAIGSVMASATSATLVWGTGAMHPELGVGDVRASSVFAVRGPSTYRLLREAGIAVGDVPLGDPALLAPQLMNIFRSPTPQHRIGLAAHYVDRHRPEVVRLLDDPAVADLNVHGDPEAFLRQMAECAVVVSSSLHGLIFAEALGIPSLWLRAGDDIGGSDFKFKDWFGTTRRPQANPHVLTSEDTPSTLAEKAELHESVVDLQALADAFPRHRVGELQSDLPRVRPLQECRASPTPVFLISFNRGAMLERAIASIRLLSRPTDIVVHDNGSDCPVTIDILHKLETMGVTVVRRPRIFSPDELNGVDDTVQSYFADWSEPVRYVVSDCDVDVTTASPTMLDVYDYLLDRFRTVECVGPMLRICDIVPDYPLFCRVMNRHIMQFWQHIPSIIETNFGEVAVLESVIDTTMALHRAGEPFVRLKSALRVYEPFEARHLDWHITAGVDETYSRTSSSEISHWNNAVENQRHETEQLEYLQFNAVRTLADGRLEIYIADVPPLRAIPAGAASPHQARNFWHAASRRLSLVFDELAVRWALLGRTRHGR
jgi:hypothetical protein